MQDFEKLGVFYLGRTVPRGDLLLYESKDLVTHAVCVGMTGSGKTGLCVSLLEEAAIDGVPAIVIDPKGDLPNLLLQFPKLRLQDFEPWVNEEDAQRQGLSKTAYAAQQASGWSKGLAEWGQDGARIGKLSQSAEFAVYTPGSTSGRPISVLRSFDAPSAEELEDRELLRDRIAGTASALLSLLGVAADPNQSREHILISTILDQAWKQGKSLDLAGLIHQIQTPPMTRVGVLDLEAFYPGQDRFKLAMSLNQLLASPGFESWMEGEPLDAGALLYSPQGKPRISVLSIAHLNDSERMFFVSILLNQVLTWMRRQPGTSSLRAILYMDEIFGFFPPIANPPSKLPLLTLLKQARAFGLGVVLATQNPADLDYKGLSNTGTWFIGRLQTERDKSRLLDGLEGAAAQSGRGFERGEMDRLLSGLSNRRFLMNNVHEDGPVLFQTRWALSYLRGPMTRAQIRSLASTAAAAAGPSEPAAKTAKPPASPVADQSGERVSLPPQVPQKFVPVHGEAKNIRYRGMLLAAVQVHFADSKNGIDQTESLTYLTPVKDEAMPVEWPEATPSDIEPDDLGNEPEEGCSFEPLAPAAAVARNYAAWSKDLAQWVYTNRRLQIFRSGSGKLCSAPGETEGEFRVRLGQSNRESRDQAIEKIRRKYASRLQTAQDKVRRAEQAVEKEQEQAQQQKVSTAISLGASVIGALFGRKLMSAANAGRVGTAARSISRSQKESSDIDRARENVDATQKQLEDLELQVKTEIESLQAAIDPLSEPLETIAVKPKKSDINIRFLTLAWVPYRGEETAY